MAWNPDTGVAGLSWAEHGAVLEVVEVGCITLASPTGIADELLRDGVSVVGIEPRDEDGFYRVTVDSNRPAPLTLATLDRA